MSEQQSSYRQIMKTTSLFGGLQVFNIAITIIRTKFIAIFLGPAGMGIAGLLTSTNNLIVASTNFGLSTSAVKNVAAANATGNADRISKIVGVLRTLVWITGLLGALLTFILAPLLSKLTFGNSDYIVAFRWISVTLLFNQLAAGQLVLLQGLRKMNDLAKSNMWGSLLGLVISVPVYYYLGVEGIVPTIILSSVASLLIAIFFSSKIKIEKASISREDLMQEGLGMLKMGFTISLSGFLGMATGYLMSIYIGRIGGVSHVGFYNSGVSIINTYMNMIFGAMATDYYPRLSGLANDNVKTRELVNQQAELAILIIAPLLIVFIIFIKPIILMMYTAKFLVILDMVQIFALGIFFKTITWAMGFMMLAKGDTKLFFISELAANIYLLIFNLIFYKYWGLTGLGYSFLISFFIAFFQGYFILKFKYGFSFKSRFTRIFWRQLLLLISSIILFEFIKSDITIYLLVLFIGISFFFSIKGINQRLDVWDLISRKFKK